MNDIWTLNEPLNVIALLKLRSDSIEDIEKNYPEFVYASFTCDDCPRAPICDLAYDPYNLDGDCLYDK